MTQVALSYTQQKAPIRPSFWSFFLTPARMGAAAGFACFILAVGLAFYQSSIPDTDTYEQFSAISDDPYADVTEIAILNTLDSF